MGFLEDRDLSDVPTISEYFKGKCVFITGGSGFIGKVLIEKLLYSCTELDRIYLLMRSKKGVKSEDRLEKIYSYKCFDRLRMQRPSVFKSKVSVINGDVLEDGLALSSENRSLLIDNVNIIFHVAASVRFDDALPQAVKMNLSGTIQILNLAQEIKNLSSLIHVSTAYCNNNQNPTEEIIYPPHADWREALQICSSMDYETLRALTPKFLGDVPNTYTFTKQLAEHAVYEHRGKLPIVIVRPSIVVASFEEPMPGWIDNFNGPTGLLVATGKGITRITLADPNVGLDYIPVDTCVKGLIAAAWIRGTKNLQPTDDVEIYNCCSVDQLNISLKELSTLGLTSYDEVVFDSIMWSYSTDTTKSSLQYFLRVLLQHFLPALMIDTLLWILGRQPMLTRIQKRIYVATLALQPFLSQKWTFENSNFIGLNSKIKKPDGDAFLFSLDDLDKGSYFSASIRGARRYLLNEKDEDIPKAKAHYVSNIVKVTFYGYIMWKMLNLFVF